MSTSIQAIAIELSNELAKRRADPERGQFLNDELDAGRLNHVTDVELVALRLCYHLELCPCAAGHSAPTGD